MQQTRHSAVAVVEEFWRLMASNDFSTLSRVLADEFVLDWPQSQERIRGPQRFIAMNREYPAHGRWQFTVHRLVGNASEVVSEVDITDGVQHARAISFFTVAAGKITRLLEYWPEAYAAPEQRRHLVELIAPMPGSRHQAAAGACLDASP